MIKVIFVPDVVGWTDEVNAATVVVNGDTRIENHLNVKHVYDISS